MGFLNAYRYWLIRWPGGEERWSFEAGARGRFDALKAVGVDVEMQWVDERSA